MIVCGDCLDVLPGLPENSVDTVITDPPYGLEFMGKDWDHGVPGVRFWREIARVAKPGAFLLAFGGTRTHHRLMVAIEDAGWEIRDCMMWLYGQGFPKSYDISRGMGKAAGAEREVVGPSRWAHVMGERPKDETTQVYGRGQTDKRTITAPATPEAQQWDGWGTALKPAWEPIIVAMNPRDGTFVNNALKWGVSGIWVDGGRIRTDGRPKIEKTGKRWSGSNMDCCESRAVGTTTQGRWPANLIIQHHPECVRRGVKREYAPKEYQDVFARTGVTEPPYREVADWDCHPDCAVRMLAEQSGEREAGVAVRHNSGGNTFGGNNPKPPMPDMSYGDTGTAARFFYTPKASKSERTCDGKVENDHPTVKPVEIMRYLVRLTKTPTGGVVLDPFAGSGTTGVACVKEGREFILVDQDEHACQIARERVKHTRREPRLL